MKTKTMKKVLVALLTVSIMLCFTGCMKTNGTIDLTQTDNYSYSGIVKIKYTNELNDKLQEKDLKTIRKEFNSKYVTVDRSMDTEGNPWLEISVTVKNLSKAKLKKLLTQPSEIENYIYKSKDDISDILDGEKVNNFVFNNRRFVVKSKNPDLNIMNEIYNTESKDFEPGAAILLDSMKQQMDELIEYSITVKFPNEVTRTNGTLTSDKKTVTWNGYEWDKIYAYFQ